jgi:hypothetical protein
MTGRIAVGTLAVVAALGLSACGSGDKPGASKTTSASTASDSGSSVTAPPVPSVAELNQELQQVLDPNTPDSTKVDMLEGGQAALAKDPDMIKKLTEAYQQNNATITVTDVTSLGDQLTATANAVINGGAPNVLQVPFVAEDGKWKLQKSWACAGLTNLGQTSPACS